MNKYYECHVTMEGSPLELKPLVESVGWLFSAIDGDPSLGNGIKCYATRHFSYAFPEDRVVQFVSEAAFKLEQAGANVIRKKVELVIYDDRSSKIKPS